MAFGNMMNPGCGCCGGGGGGGTRTTCFPPGCPLLPDTIELSVSEKTDVWEDCTLSYRAVGVFPNVELYETWWSPFLPYPDATNGHRLMFSCHGDGLGNGQASFDDYLCFDDMDTPHLLQRTVITFTVPDDGSCDPLLISKYDTFNEVTVTISG